MPDTATGLDPLRLAPAGLPAVDLRPPVIAESGDPFTACRVIDLVARIPRGRPIPVAGIVDRLNGSHADWLFETRVVLDALLQLQSNWMADYRNTAGIVIDDGPSGPTLAIEDSTRVDPWIVRQAQRERARCHDVLAAFAGRDRIAGEG